MANVAVKVNKLYKPNTAINITSEIKTASASDNVLIAWDGRDEYTQVHFIAGAAGNVVVKAGNGYAANNDLTIVCENGKEYVVMLESARFLDSDGKVKIVPAIALTGISAVSFR